MGAVIFSVFLVIATGPIVLVSPPVFWQMMLWILLMLVAFLVTLVVLTIVVGRMSADHRTNACQRHYHPLTAR